ncbi:MAG: peptidoglycan editing factor PgeF [Acidobacteria bacterium]|nr:peptidoglycan editing factor PgeF [Acidobacteriota bacterium]
MRPHPAGGFAWVDARGRLGLVCRPLARYAVHLFTTREWLLGSPSASDDHRRLGWEQVAASLDSRAACLARLHQVHGVAVVVKRAGDQPAARLPDADIIMSDNAALTLAVQTADCVPMLIADRATGAVAAAHAGWRGLAARAPRVTVEAMADAFGSRPTDLVVAVGPAISATRYEVGAEVRERFQASGFTAERLSRWFPSETRAGHWLFDGTRSATEQLADAGVPAAQIHVAELCTATYADVFCSYRRDSRSAGRLAAAIRRL